MAHSVTGSDDFKKDTQVQKEDPSGMTRFPPHIFTKVTGSDIDVQVPSQNLFGKFVKMVFSAAEANKEWLSNHPTIAKIILKISQLALKILNFFSPAFVDELKKAYKEMGEMKQANQSFEMKEHFFETQQSEIERYAQFRKKNQISESDSIVVFSSMVNTSINLNEEETHQQTLKQALRPFNTEKDLDELNMLYSKKIPGFSEASETRRKEILAEKQKIESNKILVQNELKSMQKTPSNECLKKLDDIAKKHDLPTSTTPNAGRFRERMVQTRQVVEKELGRENLEKERLDKEVVLQTAEVERQKARLINNKNKEYEKFHEGVMSNLENLQNERLKLIDDQEKLLLKMQDLINQRVEKQKLLSETSKEPTTTEQKVSSIYESIEKTIQRLSSAIKEMDKELQSIPKILKELESRIAGLKEEARIPQEKFTYSDEVMGLEREVRRSKAKLDHQIRSLAQHEEKVDDLKRDLQDLNEIQVEYSESQRSLTDADIGNITRVVELYRENPLHFRNSNAQTAEDQIMVVLKDIGYTESARKLVSGFLSKR